jgi:hypothetical protein
MLAICLVTGYKTRESGTNTRLVRVGFAVDNVAFDQVFSDNFGPILSITIINNVMVT